MWNIETALALLLLLVGTPSTPSVRIDVKHGTSRELKTKAELEQILAAYDLSKYTFTSKVVIEEGAIAHSFPVITLNVRFLNSDDELLSSYLHEQLHWHLQAHRNQTNAAIAQLRKLYPRVPVGPPEGAETEYSTYGHLVDCYLEIQADRQLIGPERTAAVIRNKGHYTWIYSTVVRDESRIAAIVKAEQLNID
jgi:hypothetical protein